jgi:hypothetical protein
MLEADKREFMGIVQTTLKVYRSDADKDVIRFWWGILEPYDIDLVRAGFIAFSSDENNKYPPVPAHIIDKIKQIKISRRALTNSAATLILGKPSLSTEQKQENLKRLKGMIACLNIGSTTNAE